jgi:hypothetical protein
MNDSDHLLDNGSDIYCHRLARIDHLGPNRRLVFTIPSIEGSRYQTVVVKLIVPAELMSALACMSAAAERSTVCADLLALDTVIAN